MKALRMNSLRLSLKKSTKRRRVKKIVMRILLRSKEKKNDFKSFKRKKRKES